MPIYEYICGGCGSVQEEIRCIADRDKGPKCETCKCSVPMHPRLSPTRGNVKNPAVPKRTK